MHTVGIVAEYNPFHKGHAYHIEKAKKETASEGVIAVMSGSFVQRGEPAVFDKWTRAFCALQGGADLILELPVLYALSSAENFAKGAVETLHATGIVDVLSFGSESGDIHALQKAAKILENEPSAFREAFQKSLKSGMTYAAAREAALCAVHLESAKLLKEPNNILAVNYLRFAKGIKAHTVKRMGAGYLDTDVESEFPSAMALRQKISEGESIAPFVPYDTSDFQVHTAEMYEEMLMYAIRTGDWQSYPSISDSIKSRLAKQDVGRVADILDGVKTRHITMASIKRALMQILTKNTLSAQRMPEYIRVLGFNNRGAEMLKTMKRTALLPIIDRGAGFKEDCPIWELEKRATDIYFIPQGLTRQDLKRPPVYKN